MNDKYLKGALVGAGDVSRFHMLAWERIPMVRIVATADPELEHAQKRAAEFGIDVEHAYSSFSDLLGGEADLDFVDIAAPPEAHLELVTLAAAHGLHINCQKPFALSLEEAHQMIQVCNEAGVILNINENWRWRPWYRKLREMVQSGAIGRPVYARIFDHSSFLVPGVTHAHDRILTWPRLILFDWGVHHIDIYRTLFGEPHSVYARTHQLNTNLAGEDRALVTLNYPDLTALLDLSWSSFAPQGNVNRDHFPMVEDLRLEGDRGTIEFVRDAENGDRIRLTTADQVVEQPTWSGVPSEAYLNGFTMAQGHFIDCLHSGARPETAAQDNINTLAITLAAYESAQLDQVVQISDYKRRSGQAP
jgi:predicted dehydrogenase